MFTFFSRLKEDSRCRDAFISAKEHVEVGDSPDIDNEPISILNIFNSTNFTIAASSLRTAMPSKFDITMKKLACDAALLVSDCWDMPEGVKKYLITQDENLREAALYSAMYAQDECSKRCANTTFHTDVDQLVNKETSNAIASAVFACHNPYFSGDDHTTIFNIEDVSDALLNAMWAVTCSEPFEDGDIHQYPTSNEYKKLYKLFETALQTPSN